jgi:ClpX C4-type zinc finger
VTHYALRSRRIPYSGHNSLFVDGKALGAVPCLAIADDRDSGVLLLHCGRVWNVRGIAGYNTLADAKRAAERSYPGISKAWMRTGISKARAEAYQRRVWKGQECSFCGRRPDQIEQMIAKRTVRICDICVREIGETMSTGRQSSPRSKRIL